MTKNRLVTPERDNSALINHQNHHETQSYWLSIEQQEKIKISVFKVLALIQKAHELSQAYQKRKKAFGALTNQKRILVRRFGAQKYTFFPCFNKFILSCCLSNHFSNKF